MATPGTIIGTHDNNTLAQLADVAERAERVALMADGHLGYIMPVGGVAAYKNQVSVAGVGFDIACGNAAIKTDIHIDEMYGTADELADEIFDTLSFGVGGENKCRDAPKEDILFDSMDWFAVDSVTRHRLRNLARKQIGTIGSGNHYVDVFYDETGTVWVGVHFGSRGFGHQIASGFMALAQGEKFGKRVAEKETLLNIGDALGQEYWTMMNLAGQYAHVGREWVVRKVVDLIGGEERDLVHNHHNFAWRERHFNKPYVVVRKGATPAFPGQRGFIGGSMGDDAVIVHGTLPMSDSDKDKQESLLYSTVHGAGRVMSRTQAKGKTKKGVVVKEGLVSPKMMADWIEREGVTLRGGGLDESPHAYRRLPDVLAAQGSTIKVLHTLTPYIVCMAPPGRSRR